MGSIIESAKRRGLAWAFVEPVGLGVPLAWKKPRRVFVNSMSDLFHEAVPFAFIDRVFAVMALCPRHTFQILTKRPERMAEYVSLRGNTGSAKIGIIDEIARQTGGADDGGRYYAACERVKNWPLPNVWLGTSCENQETLKRAWTLLKCPAAVRFLSCEPLLGAIDLHKFELLLEAWTQKRPTMGVYLDWVIVGGESGAGARPCDVGWIRQVVKQCRETKTPVFVKQLGARPESTSRDITDEYSTAEWKLKDRKGGEMSEWPEDLRVREMPKGTGAADAA